ncbi:class II glutamine amidotransferase [Candidatus Bathyarchaeota archaeon]|nr:class II glutamine amidotransferase [Candidatus Bathyarchaeota archaeon]
MCGIFGFALKKPRPLADALKVLEKLEVHQYPYEPRPVGGYGAGLAFLQSDGGIALEKIGKPGEVSPARLLASTVKTGETRVLVAHVRMPSPEFMDNARFKETAQPYFVQRNKKWKIVSIHNGKVENYQELRKSLRETPVLESEKVELIDSEVIPHLFDELLSEKGEVNEALNALFCAIHGSGAICILLMRGEDAYLHFIHKGKTRGLTIWANDQNEVVFCSRKEPLVEEFSGILEDGRFRERISIQYQEDVGLRLSFPVPT